MRTPDENSEPRALVVESPSISLERIGRRRRLGVGLVALSTLLSPASMVLVGTLSLSGDAVAALVLGSLASVGGAVAWLASLGRTRARRAPGVVTLAGEAILVERGGARERLRRADVTGGWREERDVVLQLRDEILLSFGVPDPEAAANVLRAAGVDGRALAMRLRSERAARPALGCFAVVFALFGLFLLTGCLVLLGQLASGKSTLGELLTCLLFGGGMLFVVRLLLANLLASTVTIGADGVTIQRALQRRQFIPYDDLAHVSQAGPSLVFTRRGGKMITVPASDDAERAAVMARIGAAMEAGRGELARGDVLAALDRAGRSLDAWRAHLGALLRGGADYRRAALEREDVAQIVESPQAQPERRVAAAAALAATGDAELVRRVRIAAQASADDELRIALERAAEGEIDEEAIETIAARRQVR